MKARRFLSTDIDSAQDTDVDSLRKQALQLIDRELAEDRKLHDDATAAVLNAYDGMGAKVLSNQLHMYGLILDALKNRPGFQKMVTLLTNLFRNGIYKVDGEVLDAVSLGRDSVQITIQGKLTLIGSVNSEFLNILSLGKESRETERRLTVIEMLVNDRNHANITAVSQAFKLPIGDTEKITLLIQQLFDDQGNFMRQIFDPMLDELARHGNHAFEFLWCYFKALKGHINRIAFLNALQHLISRINRPKHALRFLLADFCRQPGKVEKADRDAIMLANILLRTYNKELDVEIEMTPEEVLNVRNGLDLQMVHYAQFRIDSVDFRFFTKVRTIHEKMVAHLNAATSDRQTASVRQLLFLEREIFIFLALLSGKTAHLVLISALNEYSDPQMGIYRHSGAEAYLPVLFQHLKIIVRGVGRVGMRDDVALLQQISARGVALSELNRAPENQRVLSRTMDWIENAVRSITTADGHSG